MLLVFSAEDFRFLRGKVKSAVKTVLTILGKASSIIDYHFHIIVSVIERFS